jgi:hypothetical protein
MVPRPEEHADMAVRAPFKLLADTRLAGAGFAIGLFRCLCGSRPRSPIDGTSGMRLDQSMSSAFSRRLGTTLTTASITLTFSVAALGAHAEWKKQIVYEGAQCLMTVAGDFTKDGQPNIIANAGEKTRLFVGPTWKEVVLDETTGLDFIHSEAFDVDGDGDLDYTSLGGKPRPIPRNHGKNM